MAAHPTFLSLGFLFSCCPPCTSASPPHAAQEGPWGQVPPDTVQLLLNGREVGNLSHEARLASACIWTLPDAVSSGLRGRCLEELPVSVSNQNQNQNHTLRVLTAGCACEFLGGLRVPPNSTACAAMLQGCGGGGGGVAVAVGLSLLLLAVAGGVGCVWHWKHRGRAPLALPGFLRRRRRRRDYSKTLSAGPQGVSAKAPAPAPHPGAGEADPQDHYENLPAGAPGAPGLYENARRGPCEEHVYGNEAAGDYYNFQAPGAPASPQDEDIYILPDAY